MNEELTRKRLNAEDAVFIRARGGEFRWLTVATLLMAIGTILHMVSPSLAGFTPNWMIATYCVSILLTRPTYGQCLGIGLVAAMIEVFTSKSGFPYGNLISEPIGALTVALFAHYVPLRRTFSFVPIVAGFVATLLSGGTFVSILVYVMDLPITVLLYAMLPAVVLVAAVNAAITPVLYLPARKLLSIQGNGQLSARENTDHRGLELVPSRSGAIVVDALSYRYPDTDHDVLHHIDLAIEKGEAVVVTGPAEAGKTTLMRALIGAIPHYYGGTQRGLVFIDGRSTTQYSIAQTAERVGTILADYDAQLVTMTVGEEMAFSLENRGLTAEEIESRSTAALAKVGLRGMEYRSVASLSGGQRQRLVIASVLATEPDILVFDEPTSALDPDGIQSFYQLVGELNRRDGITVVVVEHRLEAILPLADRLILMNEGSVMADGTPEEVLEIMYRTGVHAAAVPEVYAARLALADAGFARPTSLREAEADIVAAAQSQGKEAISC